MNKFETSDYQSFLEELHKYTCIDQYILDHLIKTNLINNIFENQNTVFIEDNYFSFYYYSLRKNYYTSVEFNFFEYFLNKPEYIIFNQKEKSHSYISYAYNKKNQHIIGLYENSADLKIYCHLFFQLDINYSEEYTSDILNFKEVYSITPYFFDSLADDRNHVYAISFDACEVPFILGMTFNNISSLISRFTIYKDKFNSLITPIKIKKMQILDKYYEPAILRLKLNDF